MQIKILSGALVVAAAIATSVWAQDTPSASETMDAPGQITDLDPIVVDGTRRLSDIVGSFVGDISTVHERNGQIARFDGRICAGVIGLPAAQAQVVNDRVARAALLVGLQVGRPGCHPNVVVVITDDSDKLAADLVARHKLTFQYHVAYQERGPELLAEFQRPGRAVRWWHLTERDEMGHDGGSRLRAAYETDIFRAIILVDTRRTGPVTLEALGDYVAMTALARLSPDADLAGLDTVLSLFDTPSAQRPLSMTGWDEAYLKAVYSGDADTRSQWLQQRDIANRMLRGVRSRNEPVR